MTAKSDPIVEALQPMIEALAIMQGRAIGQHYVLQELIAALQRSADDPQRFLSAMLDGVNARMDQGDKLAILPRAVEFEMRSYVAGFFTAMDSSGSNVPDQRV
jgi:hypothetical protein